MQILLANNYNPKDAIINPKSFCMQIRSLPCFHIQPPQDNTHSSRLLSPLKTTGIISEWYLSSSWLPPSQDSVLPWQPLPSSCYPLVESYWQLAYDQLLPHSVHLPETKTDIIHVGVEFWGQQRISQNFWIMCPCYLISLYGKHAPTIFLHVFKWLHRTKWINLCNLFPWHAINLIGLILKKHQQLLLV